MRIAVLQASSQKEKNRTLFEATEKAVQGKDWTVTNLGVFEEEGAEYSYVQAALWVSLLLESGAADFVVTGCSSGQGMMLACNSLPGVVCGYVPTPADAYLFGRINDGNAVSFPLGLNFGWCGRLNLEYTLEKLFKEPFGIGYPPQDADRKRRDTELLKTMGVVSKRPLEEVLPQLDDHLVKSALSREPVMDFIMRYGKNAKLKKFLQQYSL